MPHEPDKQGLLFTVAKPSPRTASYQAVKSIEPLSRSMDPVGSFQAGARTHKTGVGSRKRLAVYHALRSNQGATSAELARTMDVDRHDVARRLPELERAGWIVRGRRRRCTVCAVECVTWFISRRWIDGPRPAVPCERPTAAKSGPGPKAAPSGGSATTGGPGGLPPVTGLSVDDRRRLRERLRQSATPQVQRFLRGLDQ
jgi:predicted transcriptional regulator